MRESLDVWYQRELDFFRASCGEFARRFPKIAARLSLGTTSVSDPHVERLIQAFAFMNARTRLKLEDGFPEIVDAILGILYPHMLAPVPSTSVVCLELDRGQKDQTSGHNVPQGTLLESERIQDATCRFRTCFPVTLFPLETRSAELLSHPFSGPSSPRRAAARSVFRISMNTFDPAISCATYDLSSMRFYINVTNFEKAARLLELLLTQSLEIVITGADSSVAAAVLPASMLRPVGFGEDETLLPQAARSFPGYRLLTEYFVLPQKFLFFDVTGFTPEILARLGNRLEISVLLKEHIPELESVVSRETIRTGCTPIINLFSKTADAVPLSNRTTEYRIVPDARAEDSLEVYSVNSVSIDDQDGNFRELNQFYQVNHGATDSGAGYWHGTRRPGPVEGDSGLFRNPTEMYVSLVDPQSSPFKPGKGLLYAELTCFNRNLPELLGQQRDSAAIRLAFAGGGGPVSGIHCLVAPTPVLRRHMGRENLWPLVSQLSLNHLSLSGTADSVVAVQEILALNDPKDSIQTKNLIRGLQSVTTQSCVQRMGDAFIRGNELRLLFDEENFAGDSAFLFASVLNHFFSMYTSINSFTKLSATTKHRESRGMERWTWQAEAGNRPLI